MTDDTAQRPLALGAQIDQLWDLLEARKSVNGQLEALDRQIADTEAALLRKMDAEGVSKTTGNRGTVFVTESIKPSVTDWDSFYAFIHNHRYYHLLERRPSVLGCRELFETKGAIPGVEPFRHRRVSHRRS